MTSLEDQVYQEVRDNKDIKKPYKNTKTQKDLITLPICTKLGTTNKK